MKTISQIRNLFIQYHENPIQFVDHARATVTLGRYTAPIKRLSEVLGLEVLGEGARAKVYALNERRVLKICERVDHGYDPFIRAAREMNNPHLPKVFYIGTWANRTVYVLERLEYGNDFEKDFLSTEMYRRFNTLDDEPTNIRWHQANNDPFGPDLTEAVRLVHKMVHNPPAGSYLRADLHGGNIMLRGDIPVITDPLID